MSANGRKPYITPAQLRVLTALCDTLVPAVDAAADPHGFWKRKASDLNIPQTFAEIAFTLKDDLNQSQLRLLLNALNHPLLRVFVTGTTTHFADLSLEER